MINFSLSWINGISAFLITLTAGMLVIYCIYLYNKNRVRTYLGGLILFSAIGLGWTGITTSFLFTELTGANPEWITLLTPFFSYSTIPLGCFGIIYIVWELAGSKKSKKIIYLLYVLLFIPYYIFLYGWMETSVDFSSNYSGYVPGQVIDDWINIYNYFFYFIYLLVMITAIITLIGFAKMRSQTTGQLKERSSLLLLATPLVALGILADTVILGSIPLFPPNSHMDFLYIIRFLMIVGMLLIIIAFRPAKVYPIYIIILISLGTFVVFYFFIGVV